MSVSTYCYHPLRWRLQLPKRLVLVSRVLRGPHSSEASRTSTASPEATLPPHAETTPHPQLPHPQLPLVDVPEELRFFKGMQEDAVQLLPAVAAEHARVRSLPFLVPPTLVL